MTFTSGPSSRRSGFQYAEAVSPLLSDGEKIEAVFWANSIRPLMNAVIVTDARVMGVSDADLRNPAKAVRQIVDGDDLAEIEIGRSRWGNTRLKLITWDGAAHGYGDVQASDADDLRRYLESVKGAPGCRHTGRRPTS